MTATSTAARITVSPASREQPRIVTQGMISAFERQNPALSGVGAHMIALGIWILGDAEG